MPTAPPSQRMFIRPAVGWQPIRFGELWRYRELLWVLAMGDAKVRYKQTALGVACAVIQPLATTVAIGSVGIVSSEGFSRPLFQYAALLPWYPFANAFSSAGSSLIGNQNLISKVYFPRLVIPIAAVMTGLIDFAISLGVLVLLMAWYRPVPPPQVALLPLFVAMAFGAALAAGLLGLAARARAGGGPELPRPDQGEGFPLLQHQPAGAGEGPVRPPAIGRLQVGRGPRRVPPHPSLTPIGCERGTWRSPTTSSQLDQNPINPIGCGSPASRRAGR